MSNNKVFISSTVYDLIDVRAEIKEMLQDIGLNAIMSDFVENGFDTTVQENSIETCLVNLRNADRTIVILSQRYGGKLGVLGYPNLSATHLEYREAVDQRKPIHFYVRDRLFADFGIWKKSSNKNDLKLNWVKSANDFGIFDLIGERERLESNSINWISIFSDSVDLKGKIRNDLKSWSDNVTFEKDFREFNVPAFFPSHSVQLEMDGKVAKMIMKFKNVGKTPAYKVKLLDTSSNRVESLLFLPPGESFTYGFLGETTEITKIRRVIEVFYQDSKGNKFKDTYDSYVANAPLNMLMSGLAMKNKQYFDVNNNERLL